MKLRILSVGFGILAMLVLTAAVGTTRAKSDRKVPARIEQKAQPAKSAARTATPGSQPARHIQASETAKSEPVMARSETVFSSPWTGVKATASANYQIPWLSINSGGGPAASTNYQTNVTAGQAAIGQAASTNYSVGIGYWYGTSGGGGGCSCPYQSDFDEDGFLTALDLGAMIDILFAGQPDVKDPDCPSPRADFDCDGFSTALDLAGLIDHLFAGGNGPCDPCTP